MDAAVVGTIMMIARFVDAFTDVTMGRICDRSKATAAGKFKPWLLRMCGPVAISSFLIYQSSLAHMPMAFKIGYLAVTYILWGSVFYTAVNIPYGSMASAISADAGDRQSLSTFRSLGGTMAGLVIGAGVPLLAYDNIDGREVLNGHRFTLITGVFSLLAVFCYILCYRLTTERVLPKEDPLQHNNHIGQMLRNALRNRALLSIIAASVVMLLSQLTLQSMANYIYPNYYRNVTAQTVSTLSMVGSMLIAGAVAKPLAARFGKAELSAAANILAAAVSAVLFFLRPQNVWLFVAIQSISWFGLGIFSMVSWALITDVIDDSELRNGIREDGSIYALYSFARKLGQAASAGLTGFLLTAIGYTESTAFDTTVISGIYGIATLVPGIGFAFLALILWFWYPLHKNRVENNILALRKKHES